MHCEQIRELLPGFTAGTLPNFKAAWVAQHLAGCEACRSLSEALAPIPVAPAAERLAAGRPFIPANSSYSLRRPIPARLWISALLLAILLMVSTPRAYLRVTKTTPQRLTLAIPALAFEAAAQQQAGVTLSLGSVTQTGDELTVRARFLGVDLSPPTSMDAWVTVLNERRHPIESRLRTVTVDAAGITLEVSFHFPEGSNAFALRIAGVNQTGVSRWALDLPAPPPALEQTEQSLGGTPPGLVLIGYGTTGDLLRVHLRAWLPPGPTAMPALSLRDGGGGTYASAFFRQFEQGGAQELVLEYAVPGTLTTPLTLVGNIVERRYLGPWLIDAKRIR